MREHKHFCRKGQLCIQSQVEALQAENKRLREFIKARAEHTEKCLQHIVHMTAKHGSHDGLGQGAWRMEECICGLRQALEGSE